jgi:hypothetical protein
VQQERIIKQLGTMAASERITPEEAARLRAAAGTAEFDAIRVRHAQAHTDAAVADGRMSPGDAEEALERVRGGEHSTALRTHIRGTG